MKLFAAATVLAASQLTAAWPGEPRIHASILTRAEQVQQEYDYIIVGGGTSGLTVGDRLSEDGQYSVLVVEYGYFDPEVNMDPRRMFNITSKPQTELNNHTFAVQLGCVVGGSSIVNGQVLLRGTRAEYDAWKQLGGPNSTWDWDGLLPYFKKGLTLNPPEPTQAEEFNITHDMQYWGTTSQSFATFGPATLDDSMKIMYNAMANMPGMTTPIDSGAGETGLYWHPVAQDNITYNRSSSRTAHWDGLDRSSYEMIVGAKVNRILWDEDESNTAVGVQFISRNDSTAPPVSVRARREVILAAGAIHTPQVLMLSGVGPAALLQQANIPVRVDLPGVGSNFQDHSWIPWIAYEWGTPPPTSGGAPWGIGGPNSPPNLAALIGLPVISPDNYESIAADLEAQGPAAHLPASYTPEQVAGYAAQHELYSPLFRTTDIAVLEIMVFGPGGVVQNLHPMSRGTVLIDPADPEGTMQVDYRAASNPVDLRVMVENIRFMRRYMTTGDLAQYEAIEHWPGANVTTDAQLEAWSRDQIFPSIFHPVGTCAKMPKELGGVVDEELRVHGVKGLRIVDASIMPTIVGATTVTTVYAVAEKAADLIKAAQ